MGYVFAMSRNLTKHNRLCNNRLCVDVQNGNVHLHYRDLRVEMSIREWEVFSKFITQVSELVKEADKDKDFKQFYETLPNSNSDFFPNRISMESDGKGLYHLHYHEIRLEFGESIFKLIDNLDNSLAIGRFMRWKLKDIAIHYFVKGSCQPRPIVDSPYYLSLLNKDRKIYDDYVAEWISAVPNVVGIMSYENHLNLCEKIRKEGFNFNNTPPIILKDDENIVVDGQHRLSILYVLHGGDCELLFRNGRAYAFVEEHP